MNRDKETMVVVGVIGAITAILLLRKRAEAEPRRLAVDGMGDLDDDGYVSEEDVDLLEVFIANPWQVPAGSPLSMGEVLRRADFTGNAEINIQDMFFMLAFIHEGTLPDPELPPRPAVNGMGDLNDDGYVSSADILLLKYYMFDFPISQLSPLSEEEFLRRADMNGDGYIDAGDITAMKNYIYGG